MAAASEPLQRPARVLVLGGSGAVGGGVVRALVRDGDRVAFTWRSNEAATRALLAEQPGLVAIRMEAREPAEVEAAVDQAAAALGGLDALVHAVAVGETVECKGAASRHRIGQVDPAAWDAMLDINARSAFFAVRRAQPHLEAAGGGNVVFFSSIDGVKSVPAPVHYTASKSALVGMARTLAKELGPLGIKVNGIAPGMLDAGLTRTLPPELREEYVKHAGLKRVGTVGEVAELAAWLCRENTYVTGQTLLVDGAL